MLVGARLDQNRRVAWRSAGRVNVRGRVRVRVLLYYHTVDATLDGIIHLDFF